MPPGFWTGSSRFPHPKMTRWSFSKHATNTPSPTAKVTLRCCTDRSIKLLWQFMPPCRTNPLLKAFACECNVRWNTLYLRCLSLNVMVLYVINGFKQIICNMYILKKYYCISICFCWQVFTRTCMHVSIHTCGQPQLRNSKGLEVTEWSPRWPWIQNSWKQTSLTSTNLPNANVSNCK